MVACLSHLTIDHASLSRRSTVPTPNKRHLQHLGAHYVFFRMFHRNVLLISSLSCFAVCDHLSPRIAIVFSLVPIPEDFENRGESTITKLPMRNKQWQKHRKKDQTTANRMTVCFLFFHEVRTAVWPREFYHGNLLLKHSRGSYFVKKEQTPCHSIRRGWVFLMAILTLFIPHW